MEYIHFFLKTPILGTDEDKYICFKEEVTEEELDNYLEELVADRTENWIGSYLDGIEEDDYDTSEDFEEALAQETEWFRDYNYGTWERVTKEVWEENEGYFN
jgi:enolase